MIPAAIYARYSSANQREESIEGQLRECKAYAARNGYRIVREYTDAALSGKTDKRPGFQRMIADSDLRIFQVVIVWKLDRFARDRYDAAIYRKRLSDNGVRLCSAMEGISDSPEGIIMEGLLDAMAEYYSANLSENIKRGQYDSALKRKVFTSAVLGYRKGSDGRYEIDPATAPIVQRIFREYTNGSTRPEIIEGLNADGLRTSKGKPFSKNSLSTILANEKYIGMYRYKGIEDPKGIPAIIDLVTFSRAQEITRKRKFKKSRRNMNEDTYMLVPKVFCGECGRMMTGESAKSHTGKIYQYYSCTGRKGKERNGCKKTRVLKDQLEKALIRAVNEQILTDEMIETFVEQYTKNREAFAEENSSLIAYQSEQKEVTRKIRNVNKAIADGIWTASVQETLLSLENRREELEILIAEEERRNVPIPPEMLREYFQRLRTASKSESETQRTLLDIFLRRVYVFDPEKKNGPFRTVFEISLTGSDGEPVAYELMLGRGSSEHGQVVLTVHDSNPFIVGDSLFVVLMVDPSET